MTLEALTIVVEQGIDETEQLHDTLILANVLMAFQTKFVSSTITTLYLHLSRSLLRRYDPHVSIKTHDADDRFTALVSAGDGQSQILTFFQLGRNVRQVKSGHVL